MQSRSLMEVARGRVVLTDGGIGTELQRAGLEPGGCGECWNADRPDRVSAIHRAYAEAGAEALLTNTFGGSRIALDRHGAGDRARELNRAAAALARGAAGDGWVLGDIGPFGGFLEPLGEHPADVVESAFREQAEALLEGGADGLLVETMTALDELALAVRAGKAAGAPFVIASVAFDATKVGPRTMMGVAPEAAAAAALDAGADALGANCGTGLGMAGYADVLRRYRDVAPDTVLLCRPNAGTPRVEGQAVVYDLTPERMATEVGLLADAGATVIGGCCGTTPAHIAAMQPVLGA
ncbi:MAG: homocysteine methyltransferase [Gemmatimonadetes bacterium]|nr:homocysteine methyltransferase [Gemmatimonadota bacterium]NIQ52258.1 homocysteine methyltransferase [Gemmatimonadota bacterium]NIU72360.1 homocysteine methyltransferase [Gammaproteobacteria bacterium]NIX42842.1 homocysteine methyltransferase [Gemmatimonadota bacterium]NIY07019.1 homocysteine methyltransferase [Gemmatimonadota bacterium]